MKPVVMIDKAIESVSRRDSLLCGLGSGTVGCEVVKEHPGAYLEFSGRPVAMKVA